MDNATRKKLEESGHIITSPEEFYNFLHVLSNPENETERIISKHAIKNIQKIRKELNIDPEVFIIPA